MDSGNEKYPEVYFCIDQKSFYASVECVLRGLDPMTALLVVADAERSKNTICLAVSVGCKKKGIKNRCRLGDVPPNMGVIVAPPQMQLYIDCAAEIHGVFLKYFAPEDIYVYSIDESFIYVTPYLRMYHLTPRELAAKVIADIRNTVGTLSTCGIGSNLYLAKVALDIQAKHAPDGIAELTQRSYQEQLWQHQPLTDFWRVGSGTANRLRNRGITTMQGITESDPDSLYKLFGINAELLIDHAWGRESCTIADIKAYKSSSKSLSSSQVLMRDYKPEEAIVVAKEMADQLCLDMAAKQYLTESVCLYIGYSYTQGVPGTGGTASLAFGTNLSSVIVPAVDVLYRRIVRQGFAIRQIGLSCPVYPDTGAYQLNMFEDTQKQLRGKALQETLLGIRSKFGKNAILKGINYDPSATGRERNMQIGGHRSGSESSQGTHAQK